MATLTVTQTTDFRPPPDETAIDQLVFGGAAGTGVTATFSAAQFGAGLIGPAITVTGGASQDHIRIFAPADDPSLHFISLADWTFIDWSPRDRVTIVGGEHLGSIIGSKVADVIYGRDLIYNWLRGDDGDDLIYGAAGTTNRLDGGLGNDTLYGGHADDLYVLDSEGDVFFEPGTSSRDEVEAWLSLSLQDRPEIEDLTLKGTATWGTGNAAGNVIESTLTVTLSGLGGNDQLRGGAGSTLIGGDGDDYYKAGLGDVTIIEESGPDGGTDLVAVTLEDGDTFVLPANVENISAYGEGTVIANELDNYIYGQTSWALLVLAGGDGNDTYDLVSGSGPAVVEEAGDAAGTADLVIFAGNLHTLAANVENLIAGYHTNDDIRPLGSKAVGNDLNNWMRSETEAGDAFYGMGGDDLIETDDGDDTLYGGDGSDTLVGGRGNDIYVNPDSSDLIVEEAQPYRDDDAVHADFSFSLANVAFVENLRLEGTADLRGEGSSLDNRITGNTGANLLKGWAGRDTILGGDGADTLRGGDGNDSLSGGRGSDELFSESGHDIVFGEDGADRLHGGDGNDTMDGGVSDDLLRGDAGNDSLSGGNGLDTLDGGAGSDTLIGGLQDDSLIGGAGNDTLIGGLQDDTLIGGAGNDTYFFDRDDTFVELAGGGIDTIVGDVLDASLVTPAEFENLVLTGSGNAKGLGNAGANAITGNAGANLLKGWAGSDTIRAGLGDDTLRGGDDNDSLFGDEGKDVLYGELGRDNLRGGDGDDLLNGGDDADKLWGEAGADTLIGTGGDDTMDGGADADVFRFRDSGNGTDRIENFEVAQDRFDLTAGQSFTGLVENNGNTALFYAGGAVLVTGVAGLSLVQWNALVLPDGGGARLAGPDDASLVRAAAAMTAGDYLFA